MDFLYQEARPVAAPPRLAAPIRPASTKRSTRRKRRPAARALPLARRGRLWYADRASCIKHTINEAQCKRSAFHWRNRRRYFRLTRRSAPRVAPVHLSLRPEGGRGRLRLPMHLHRRSKGRPSQVRRTGTLRLREGVRDRWRGIRSQPRRSREGFRGRRVCGRARICGFALPWGHRARHCRPRQGHCTRRCAQWCRTRRRHPPRCRFFRIPHGIRASGQAAVEVGEVQARARESKVDRTFARQYGDQTSAASSGPRAALYKGEMGASHKRAARMQNAGGDAGASQRRFSAGHALAALSPRMAVSLACVAMLGADLRVPVSHREAVLRDHARVRPPAGGIRGHRKPQRRHSGGGGRPVHARGRGRPRARGNWAG